MAIFLLNLILKKQIFYIIHELLSAKADGTIDDEAAEFVRQLLGDQNAKGNEGAAVIYKIFDQSLLKRIVEYFTDSKRKQYFKASPDELSSNYQYAIYKYVENSESDEFYETLFLELFPTVCAILLDQISIDKKSNKEILNRTKDRINYCLRNEEYVKRFISSNLKNRTFNNKLEKHTWLIMDIWSVVKEACSDIAMISLNGLQLEDYMLFCIQAWTDANDDRRNVVENLQKEEMEQLRYALVTQYFHKKRQTGWNEYIVDDKYCSNLKEEIKKKFYIKYIWFYRKKILKN